MTERTKDPAGPGRVRRNPVPPEVRTEAVRMPTSGEHIAPWMQAWLTQGQQLDAQASDWVVRDPDSGDYRRLDSDEFIRRFFALSTFRGVQAPVKVQRRDARWHPRPGDVVGTDDEERWVICQDNRHRDSSYYRVYFSQRRGDIVQEREVGIDLWRRWARRASHVSYRRRPWRYGCNWPRETTAIVKVTRVIGSSSSDVLIWWELCGGRFQLHDYYPSFSSLQQAMSFLNELGVGNPDVVDTAGRPVSE